MHNYYYYINYFNVISCCDECIFVRDNKMMQNKVTQLTRSATGIGTVMTLFPSFTSRIN